MIHKININVLALCGVLLGTAIAQASQAADYYFRGTPNQWGATLMAQPGSDTWKTCQVFSSSDGDDTPPRFKINEGADWSKPSWPENDYVVDYGSYTITFTLSSGYIDVQSVEGCPASPAVPTGLSVQRNTGVGVSLGWTDVASNETAYIVRRASAEAPQDWKTLVANLPANTASYTDGSINEISASGYFYQIRAANGVVISDSLDSDILNPVGYQHPKAGSLAPVNAGSWGAASWRTGAHFNNGDLELAVYSKNAHRILLEVYERKHWAEAEWDRNAAQARKDYWLVKGVDNIWRAKLDDVPEGTLYAFRAWGPNWTWDESWQRGHSAAGYISDVHREGPAGDADSYIGHRFNPNKVLTDPYAYELSHDTDTPEMLLHGDDGGLYGTGGADLVNLVANSTADSFRYVGPITNDVAIDRRNVDTALWAPKSVAVNIAPYTAIKPAIPMQNTVQMESHVRGLTKHPSTGNLRDLLTNYQHWFDDFNAMQNIPEAYRGTYKGAAMMAPYLKALGINVIEFLPVHETRNDTNQLDHEEAHSNFWGYMTYSFFAPDRYYAYDKSYGGPTREFREMVQAFNAQGIEVWLDVVYNHTGEGGNLGNSYVTAFNSYGGFDAAEYYHLDPFDKRSIVTSATGTGNQMNFSREVNHNLVLDSLSYWIDSMGVSGFRFDLAAVLGRDPDLHEGKDPSTYWNDVKTFYSDHPTLLAIRDLSWDRNAKVVAEAWDLWGYPVGLFPNGWAEWNGRYRDATRKFLKGDPSGHDGVSPNDAFHGDYNFFSDNGGPHKSVNLLVAHDGFTLADLVSYNIKNNNQDHPFGPSDGGSDSNESWDSTGDAKPSNLTTQEFRRQRLRNFWTFQFFSRGVPMIVYGDEFGRTQNGNNNPYALDTPATWNNYNMLASNAPQTVPVHPDFPLAAYHNNLGTGSNSNASVNPLLVFARDIIQRRKNEPALRQADYAMPIYYASETGGSLSSTARARRMHLAGSAVGGSDYVLFVNMWTARIDFSFPTPPANTQWARIVDTAHWAEAVDMNTWSDAAAWRVTDPASEVYGVNPWSIVVFKAVPQ
jgi:isoamylase